MRLTLEINADNAAFGDTPDDVMAEIARILHELANMLPETAPSRTVRNLRDFNGNIVGIWSIT